MTAKELLEQMPEFPEEIRVRTRSGQTRHFSRHPTPYLRVTRMRSFDPDTLVVRYVKGSDEVWQGLLVAAEPYEFLGLVRFDSQIEPLEANALRNGITR